MNEEKPLSEQESLKLITDMIQKAKGSHFHEDGTSAILWGSVVGFCGLLTFAERYWNFRAGFDVWILTLIALIPQVYISIKESKNRVVKTHQQQVLDAVWIVYTISIFAVIAYLNIIPSSTERLLTAEGTQLFKKAGDTPMQPFKMFVPSSNSLLIIIYAIPTLVTGLSCNFKPMIWGGIACYIFFAISLYANTTYDNLLNGLAGIGNWLIPGLILRIRYQQVKLTANV